MVLLLPLLLFVGLSGLAAAVTRLDPMSAKRSVRLTLWSAAGLFGVFAIVVAGMWVWAASSTANSQLARSIMWGGSDTGDIDRFPSRVVEAGDDTSELPRRPVEGFGLMMAEGTDRTLDELLDASEAAAFVVVRDGEVIYERYPDGAGAEQLRTSFSMAKSVMATLIGIAVERGEIGSLDTPITGHLPELAERDERFAEITVRHLLTMSSGLAFRDGSSPWADPSNTYYTTDLRAAALEQTEVERPPGEVFHYNDWNTVLLGVLLERATGRSPADYLSEYVWVPMGAEADASWSLDSDESGFEKSFVGVNARAADWARFGLLYLNGGVTADGSEVVPGWFVDEATRLDGVGDPNEEYQYQWWIDVGHGGFYAAGDHCQFVYVAPEHDTVVVRVGDGCGELDGFAWIPTLRSVAAAAAAQDESDS